MAHVVHGQLNKQVAADLGTVEKTIKVHRARVMEKMGVESLAELVLVAQKLGVFSPEESSRAEQPDGTKLQPSMNRTV
jgi:DNA-binding NarL/FixJ family response regulator